MSSKLPPELVRFARRQREVDKAKALILDGIIAKATEKRCSLFEAARQIGEMLPEDKRDHWDEASRDVMGAYERKVKDEAWERAMCPGGK